jgi:hypothetical protein
MQDADQQYPLRQPRRGGHDDDTESDLEEQLKPPSGPIARGPLHQRQAPTSPHLPRGRVKNTLIIGIIAGILCSIQSIVITIVNSSTYQAYITTPGSQQSVKNAIAFTITALACLTFFISMFICFIAGFISGKVAVERRMGFLAGFVAGALTYGLSFLLNLFPGYPTHLASSASSGSTGLIAVSGGLLVSLIFLLIWGVIGGLASLLGAWLATRKHPYYYVQ